MVLLGACTETVNSSSHVVILVEDIEWRQGIGAEYFPVFDYVISPFSPIVAVGREREPRQEKVSVDNGITRAS